MGLGTRRGEEGEEDEDADEADGAGDDDAAEALAKYYEARRAGCASNWPGSTLNTAPKLAAIRSGEVRFASRRGLHTGKIAGPCHRGLGILPFVCCMSSRRQDLARNATLSQTSSFGLENMCFLDRPAPTGHSGVKSYVHVRAKS